MNDLNTMKITAYEDCKAITKGERASGMAGDSEVKNNIKSETGSEENKCQQHALYLKSFDGYTGKEGAYRMCNDPDTGETYIINPDLEGLPTEIYSYKTISIFKDQHGDLVVANLPDPDLGHTNVWGETVYEFLERSTKEWVVPPCACITSVVPPKIDLPDPEPFEESYPLMVDILYIDNLIDELDHPVIVKLMKNHTTTN